MALTNEGAVLLAQMLKGASVVPCNTANAYIGVGNGTTAFSAAHTDLQGASKARKLVETAPTGASNVLVYQTTFGPSEANFDWWEHGLFNAVSGGTMVGRKVEASSLGTKGATQSWTFQLTVTLSAT